MENPNELSNFRKSVNARFTQLTTRLNSIQPKVDEMHDYLLVQKGVEEGKSTLRSDGSININRDVWQLIIKLVGIIGTIVGAVYASRIIK